MVDQHRQVDSKDNLCAKQKQDKQDSKDEENRRKSIGIEIDKQK
jgi:hypothetical protein